MPAFDVSRSIRISAPPSEVHALVRDFKKWPAWSPWLIADPVARLKHSDDGDTYSWEGPVTGSGEMSVTRDEPPKAIHYRLDFIKPWKSTNQVSLLFKETEGGTEATWTMTGTLPFFMFWMKSSMSAFIGADYDRGLRMLKDLIETGSVPSKLEFPGVSTVGGTAYVGINTECAIDEISTHMGDDFEQLWKWLEESGSAPTGKAFSICPKWDPVKGIVRYTAAIPLGGRPESLPAGFVSGTRPECRAYAVRHTGAYRHLGNAWTAGMMHGRSKVFSPTQQFAPFEIYESDPETTPEEELLTVIHLPAK